MSKRKTIFITCCALCLLAFAAVTLAQQLMSVQVKEAQLRSAPSFLGKIVEKVEYGKKVEVLEDKGDWHRGRAEETSTEGWMHTSALSKKEIILNPGKEDIQRALSSDEIVLAGKGIGPEVEKKFREGNTRVDYVSIDKMEQRVISHAQMLTFLKEGELSPEGGSR